MDLSTRRWLKRSEWNQLYSRLVSRSVGAKDSVQLAHKLFQTGSRSRYVQIDGLREGRKKGSVDR